MKRQQRRERGRHRWLRHGRAIGGDVLAEVLDRIARASVVVAEVLGRFGMAMGDYARSVGGVAVDSEPGLINEMSTLDDLAFAFVDAPRSLPVTEPWPEPDAALRLAYDTPLLPEQARSLIQEHGLEFAQRVGELVLRGMAWDHAVDALTGRLGPSSEAYARMHLGERGRCIPFNPIATLAARHPRCPWPPRHGTPSSFVEVCGDAAVGRVRTACDRCGFYSPPSPGKTLTCALHPMGRPEGRCGDWEARGAEVQQALDEAEARLAGLEELDELAQRAAPRGFAVSVDPNQWTDELRPALLVRVQWLNDRPAMHGGFEISKDALLGMSDNQVRAEIERLMGEVCGPRNPVRNPVQLPMWERGGWPD